MATSSFNYLTRHFELYAYDVYDQRWPVVIRNFFRVCIDKKSIGTGRVSIVDLKFCSHIDDDGIL